jgi:thiol-disulfide isomerase/thioredoxin
MKLPSTGTLLGGFIAATTGILIFLVVQNSTVDKHGVPHLSTKPAAAECTKDTIDCKPKLTFVDTNGEAYPPEALQGKVLVVNFWATWCNPCQHEIPALSRVYTKFKDQGVVMLGVMTDDPDAQKLLNFESDHELLYPVVRADKDIMTHFLYPDAIPTTFVYDRNGHLRGTPHQGGIDEDELTAELAQLLAEK